MVSVRQQTLSGSVKADAGSFRLCLMKLEAAIGSMPNYRLTCVRQKPWWSQAEFLDVTLVRDDQRQFEAHKMYLVAGLVVTIWFEAGELDQVVPGKMDSRSDTCEQYDM